MAPCNNNTIRNHDFPKCLAVSCSLLYVYKQNLVSESNDEGRYFRNSTVCFVLVISSQSILLKMKDLSWPQVLAHQNERLYSVHKTPVFYE